MTKDEILAEYQALHNALGTRKDAVDKEDFDKQHEEVWANCDIALEDRKLYLASKSSLSDENVKELRELKARLK